MKKSFLQYIKIGIAFAIIINSIACNRQNNVSKEGKLYIPTGATFAQIIDSISPLLKDAKSFEKYAKSENMDRRFYSGRYSIKAGMSNVDLVSMIQQGKQDEISIRIGNYASITELAAKMGSLLESDSTQILTAIVQSDFAKNIDTANQIYFFIPNTYNFNWNTSGKEFADKMYKEFQKFWTDERTQQAKTANMSPLEVTTLASIVQLESAKPDEQAKVAALYLNRLKIGMKLDADPTVVYIKRKQNGFTQKVSRVYYKDLAINSPYNTYKNKGLPPSPICMPNPSAIDAVLKPATHEYIYFVADPEKPGYHVFAKTLAEQEANAAKYRTWADKNNVK